MSDGTQPYLEPTESGRGGERVVIDRLPFRLGRSRDADLMVADREVSSLHAELVAHGERGVAVRDLGSRNGTFVNGDRVDAPVPLTDGDIVHIAHVEYRFGWATPIAFADERTVASHETSQQQLVREASDLGRVFSQRAVSAAFQPIVRLADRGRCGYESLGRPTGALASYSVGGLFRIAGDRGQGARLSRLFREAALAELARLPERPVTVFFNLHPHEMTDRQMLDAELTQVARALGPEQRAVLEIHEQAVTDLAAMAEIRARLRDLDLGLAYDDFGAGQSRLMELVEVPPDYLKLDMSLVRDIDRHPRRQELVRALVAVMTDLGIAVLAEGVERADEGDLCRSLGCTLAQGYFYGRPAPAGG